MSIKTSDIQHIADLARLKIEPNEIETFTSQFSEILAYMETLSEVDTENIPPMSHPGKMVNAFREDKELESIPLDEALSNAPACDEYSFIVPKVVG